MHLNQFVPALLVVCLAANCGSAQTPASSRQPYDGSDSLSGPQPIHVDQNCRILPRNGDPLAKKTRPYRDDAICSLEGPVESDRREERVSGHQLLRWFVAIKEQTFVLTDVGDQPVVFIVERPVPKNWSVDSDPQPWQMAGGTAFFRVYVQPGETVRLHVGIRRMWPEKPKPI